MWIPKKKWNALEKRIADLEGQVQSQLNVEIDVNTIRQELQNYRKDSQRKSFMVD